MKRASRLDKDVGHDAQYRTMLNARPMQALFWWLKVQRMSTLQVLQWLDMSLLCAVRVWFVISIRVCFNFQHTAFVKTPGYLFDKSNVLLILKSVSSTPCFQSLCMIFVQYCVPTQFSLVVKLVTAACRSGTLYCSMGKSNGLSEDRFESVENRMSTVR